MTSATKTLELLSFFSEQHPEIGLSQFCKLTSRDKATTYRYLQSLEIVGFIEKNPLTKKYRMGPAVLPLAQIRERTVPRKSAAKASVEQLADATGETAHVSVLSGTTLYSLVAVESPKHSTRAIVDLKTLPLHATASGICTLAYGPDILTQTAKQNLERFTAKTQTTEQGLDAAIQRVKETGFSHSKGSIEEDIYGLSAPLFDQSGTIAGAVSVASVATRFNADTERTIKHQLILASRQISHNWGGSIPNPIEACWSKTLAET